MMPKASTNKNPGGYVFRNLNLKIQTNSVAQNVIVNTA